MHPDKNLGDSSAAGAFLLLEKWKTFANEKVKAGTYGKRNSIKPVMLTSKTTAYTFYEKLEDGDICTIYAGMDKSGKPVIGKIPRDPKNNDLLENEFKALKYLRNEAVTKDLKAMCHLPRIENSVMLTQAGKNYRVNVIASLTGYVSLRKIIDAYPDGLDIRDAAWMFNRLLGAILVAQQAGVVHGAILPEHVMVDPVNHNAVLMDWCYASTNGALIKAISSRNKSLYAPEILGKKKPSTATDIYMAAKCLKLALGKKLDGCHPSIYGIISACFLTQRHRTGDAWELFNDFKQAMEAVFGPRKFRKFDWPISKP